MSNEMIVGVIANLLALLALFLHFIPVWRSRVKIRISQVRLDEAYGHKIVQYLNYDFSFICLRIENLTRADVTIVSFELFDSNGNAYEPSELRIANHINKNGIAYELKDEPMRFISFDVKASNHLNNLRFDGLDSREGYLTFMNGPVIGSSDQKFTLRTKTTTKTYNTDIIIHPLPDNYIIP